MSPPRKEAAYPATALTPPATAPAKTWAAEAALTGTHPTPMALPNGSTPSPKTPSQLHLQSLSASRLLQHHRLHQPRSPAHAKFLRHTLRHYQQALTADVQLSRLLSRCHSADFSVFPETPTMAEALLGLAPARGIDAPSSKVPISHIDQLQEQLRHILQLKSSPTRTEHVDLTFDIRPTAQFTILESAGNVAEAQVDPALDGATATPAPETTRTVRVHETVMNQPQENPATQRAVANNIVGLLSAVDSSSWVVRHISRETQGWTFTYICKESFASWARQNAKNPEKPLIGEYSSKELDPATVGRPAFDCRGSLSIAFSKSSRSINIKYDHSPLHKTVGDLIEHFRPPPRPVPVPVAPAPDSVKKTPKKRKSQAAAENGEEGADDQPKKTPRKRKSQEGGAAESGQPPKRRKKKSTAAADGTGADATNGAVSQHDLDRVILTEIFPDFSLNVTPAEAARRRGIAIQLLSEGGVDPETLSAEQLTIFSNQSPELQKESLAMLVQYGAERLRIVHPAKTGADGAASQSPQPPEANATAAASTPTVPTKKRSRKSKAGAADDDVAGGTPTASKKTPKPKLSRGSCSLCRGSKTKCDKAKPSCGPCQEAGIDCQYPLEVSRGSKPAASVAKSAAKVTEEDEEEAEAEEEEPDDIETIDYTSNMPVATMLTPAVDTSTHDYFSTSSEFPPALVSSVEDHGVAPSSLAYPEPPAPASNITHSQPPIPTYSHTQTQPESPRARRAQAKTSARHALPSGTSSSAAAETPYVDAPSTYNSNWQASAPSQGSRSTATRPSQATHQAATRQHRSHASTQEQPAAVQDARSADTGLINMNTLTNAALQQQSTSPAVQPPLTVSPAQVSPYQAPPQVASSKSRTAQRAQTRTPLAATRSETQSHHHTVQQNMITTTAPTADTTAYASGGNNAHTTRYSSSTANKASSRLSYEPYAVQNAAAASNNSYRDTGTRSSTASRNIQSTPQRPMSTSYSSSTSANYGRKSPAHTSGLANPPATSYADSMTNSNRQTASLPTFNMRADNTQSAQSLPSYNQPEKSYNEYSSTRQQPQSQQQSQQGWYSGFTAANTTSSYDRGSNNYSNDSTNSDAYQQHQHQQNSQLNMGNQGYGAGDGDYFEMLRNMNNNTGR